MYTQLYNYDYIIKICENPIINYEYKTLYLIIILDILTKKYTTKSQLNSIHSAIYKIILK